MQQQQAFPLQQEPLQQQQQQQASYPNQLPTQYQQQPPPQQQFYQPAATTSQPNTFYNQQQQPVYAPAEPAIVAPDLQNHTSAMQQPAFANSPRQRSQNRSARASLSQQGLSVAPSVREKRKVKFGDKNIWFGGESVVGRKGDDGEWMEVGCSVM